MTALMTFGALVFSCAPNANGPAPDLTETGHKTHAPAKSPPTRYMEDAKIREAKHKYIPKEVWDVAGSPHRPSEIRHLESAVAKEPDNPEPLFLLGFVHMEDRNNKKAEEIFKKVLQIQKDHYLAAGNLALIYLRREDYRNAGKTAAAGLKSNPRNPFLLGIMGAAITAENPAEGVLFYRKALSAGDSPVLRAGLAGALYRQNPENTESAPLLEKCISENPLYADAYLQLAEIKYDRGFGDDAIEILKAQIQKDPTFNESYRLAGEICLEYGYISEAGNYLEKALSIQYKPDDSEEIRLDLARYCISAGTPQKAEEILKKSKSPKNAIWLAIAENSPRNLPEGAKGKISGEEDDETDALFQFATARIHRNPKKGALIIKKLRTLPADRLPFPLFRLCLEEARLHKMTGDLPQAKALIKTARLTAINQEKAAIERLVQKDHMLKELKEVYYEKK